jgi:hypothetical protein
VSDATTLKCIELTQQQIASLTELVGTMDQRLVLFQQLLQSTAMEITDIKAEIKEDRDKWRKTMEAFK